MKFGQHLQGSAGTDDSAVSGGDKIKGGGTIGGQDGQQVVGDRFITGGPLGVIGKQFDQVNGAATGKHRGGQQHRPERCALDASGETGPPAIWNRHIGLVAFQ